MLHPVRWALIPPTTAEAPAFRTAESPASLLLLTGTGGPGSPLFLVRFSVGQLIFKHTVLIALLCLLPVQVLPSPHGAYTCIWRDPESSRSPVGTPRLLQAPGVQPPGPREHHLAPGPSPQSWIHKSKIQKSLKTERFFITTLVAKCEVIQGCIYPPSVDIHVLFC